MRRNPRNKLSQHEFRAPKYHSFRAILSSFYKGRIFHPQIKVLKLACRLSKYCNKVTDIQTYPCPTAVWTGKVTVTQQAAVASTRLRMWNSTFTLHLSYLQSFCTFIHVRLHVLAVSRPTMGAERAQHFKNAHTEMYTYTGTYQDTTVKKHPSGANIYEHGRESM